MKKKKGSITFLILMLMLLTASYTMRAVFGVRPILVVSDSMKNYMPRGSVILIKRSRAYKIGDVITFKFKNVPGNLISHRIKNIKEVGGVKLFYTKGDSNNFSDPVPVSEREIIGKAFFVISRIGGLILLIFKPWVIFVVYYIPAGFYLGNLIRSLRN